MVKNSELEMKFRDTMKDIVEEMALEREERISIDEIISHFGQFADALRDADPEVNRAYIIVEACRRFFVNGYREGLKDMWICTEAGGYQDPFDEDPDEGHELTLEDLGL